MPTVASSLKRGTGSGLLDRRFVARMHLLLLDSPATGHRLPSGAASRLKRLEHRQEYPTFEEIILNIMPLLKNGATPEDQTVLKVLESVVERVGADRWRLIKGD